jgi:hypothetical protein
VAANGEQIGGNWRGDGGDEDKDEMSVEVGTTRTV